MNRSIFVNDLAARDRSGLSGCNCNHDGLGSLDIDREEQEKARKTTDETVKEASQWSNPNVPFPLKLTGLAVLAFAIWKTG